MLGLFGKKAWDSSELHWKGETVKPAKEKVQAEIETPPAAPVKNKAGVADPCTPLLGGNAPQSPPRHATGGPGAQPPVTGPGSMTLEEVDARLLELCKEKGIEP